MPDILLLSGSADSRELQASQAFVSDLNSADFPPPPHFPFQPQPLEFQKSGRPLSSCFWVPICIKLAGVIRMLWLQRIFSLMGTNWQWYTRVQYHVYGLLLGKGQRKEKKPKCYAASEGTALRPTEKETYSSFLCIHEPTTKFKISHVKLGDHLEKKAGIKHLTFVKSPAGSAHLLQHPSSHNGKQVPHRNLQTRTENNNLSQQFLQH